MKPPPRFPTLEPRSMVEWRPLPVLRGASVIPTPRGAPDMVRLARGGPFWLFGLKNYEDNFETNVDKFGAT